MCLNQPEILCIITQRWTKVNANCIFYITIFCNVVISAARNICNGRSDKKYKLSTWLSSDLWGSKKTMLWEYKSETEKNMTFYKYDTIPNLHYWE